MVELRCNNCVHMKENYCNKLDAAMPNCLAKLFYGGAEGIYSGTIKYPSKCGIEKENNKPQVLVIIPEIGNEDEQLLEDPTFMITSTEW